MLVLDTNNAPRKPISCCKPIIIIIMLTVKSTEQRKRGKQCCAISSKCQTKQLEGSRSHQSLVGAFWGCSGVKLHRDAGASRDAPGTRGTQRHCSIPAPPHRRPAPNPPSPWSSNPTHSKHCTAPVHGLLIPVMKRWGCRIRRWLPRSQPPPALITTHRMFTIISNLCNY